jgi:hypothetical protein
VHFGLGELAKIDSIDVIWPDGSEEEFLETKVDRHYILQKGKGNRK